MKNSDDPATGEYAEKIAALLTGERIFHDLDVRTVMQVRR
jgi:hypothetical protein